MDCLGPGLTADSLLARVSGDKVNARIWRPSVKAFGGFIVGLAAVVACIFGVYQVVHPSRTPSFSQSNIGTYANANAFLSFLSGHQGQKVTLNVTCIES